MKKIIKLTNHDISHAQWEDLENHYGLNKNGLAELPSDLQKAFTQVPSALLSLETYASPFLEWIKSVLINNDDFIWIQGEPGLCYLLIKVLKEQGLKVYYATTRRISQEKGGLKTSIFEHVLFREYE